MRKLMLALVTLAIALIIGPVAFAAVASFAPQGSATPGQLTGQPSEAMRLLQTFDAVFPQGIPMYSIDTGFFTRECGYDEAEVLGEMTSEKLRDDLSPYSGYFDLQGWIEDEFQSKVEEARVNQLDRSFSSFETKFLTRCIANSAFSMLCGYRVYRVLEERNLYSKYTLPSEALRPNQAPRMKTMCRFLDGVAARQGQPLGKPSIGNE